MSGSEEKTKAPLIIFGAMIGISIVCVGAVLYTHSRREEPYLDSVRVRRKYTPTGKALIEEPTLRKRPIDAGLDR